MQHPHVVKHHALAVLQPVAQQTSGAVADLEIDNVDITEIDNVDITEIDNVDMTEIDNVNITEIDNVNITE